MDYFRTIREREKLTQMNMAKRLNISYSHYTKLERGFVKPSFDLLKRIKDTFELVDINEFFK